MPPKGKTDRQTDKSTRWAFTAYEDQWSLFEDISKYNDIAEWGYQIEVCPTTDRRHYQGYLRTHRQVRFSALHKIFPGVHLEVAREWNRLLSYCKKTETAQAGTQQHEENATEYWSMDRLFMEMATYAKEYEATYASMIIDNRMSERVAVDAEYWECVNSIVDKEPYRISMFATPQVKTLWAHTRRTWIAKVGRGDSITAPASPTEFIEIVE